MPPHYKDLEVFIKAWKAFQALVGAVKALIWLFQGPDGRRSSLLSCLIEGLEIPLKALQDILFWMIRRDNGGASFETVEARFKASLGQVFSQFKASFRPALS